MKYYHNHNQISAVAAAAAAAVSLDGLTRYIVLLETFKSILLIVEAHDDDDGQA